MYIAITYILVVIAFMIGRGLGTAEERIGRNKIL
jgi:hypothetical protein